MKLTALQAGNNHSARKWPFFHKINCSRRHLKWKREGKQGRVVKKGGGGQRVGIKWEEKRPLQEIMWRNGRKRHNYVEDCTAWAWLDFANPKKKTCGLCSRLPPPFCQLGRFRWVELEEGLMKSGNWASQAAKWCSQQIGWLDWFSDWCCSWSRSGSSRWDKLSRRSDDSYGRHHGSSFGVKS